MHVLANISLRSQLPTVEHLLNRTNDIFMVGSHFLMVKVRLHEVPVLPVQGPFHRQQTSAKASKRRVFHIGFREGAGMEQIRMCEQFAASLGAKHSKPVGAIARE